MEKICIAGVLVEVKEKFIILQRAPGYYAGWWGLPAGGIKPGETPKNAASRELREETGIVCAPDALTFVKEFLWKRDEKRAIQFSLFRINYRDLPEIKLCPEHVAFRWVTPEECATTPNLLEGFDDILETLWHIPKKEA